MAVMDGKKVSGALYLLWLSRSRCISDARPFRYVVDDAEFGSVWTPK